MSDASNTPEPSAAQAPSLPAPPATIAAAAPPAPRRVLLVSAAAIALAATAGAVFGFAWSGGGVPAVAETPAVMASAAPVLAAGAPAPGMLAAAAAGLPGFADIVQRVSPAVVSIRAKVAATQEQEIKDEDLENLPPSMREFFERFRRSPNRPRTSGEVQGSGFVIESSGYLVTNNHVVATATEIEVIFSDGKKFKAKLVGRDEGTDVALLKIQGGSNFPTVTFADDRNVRVGDWVVAVGNPFGLGGTVTAGIVSARGRDEVGGTQFTDYLQIDASINRGNSGGPAFDLTGHVIGMNTAIFSPSGGSVGIGFAIPSSTVQRVVAELKKSGAVTRGWLGVQIQSVDEDTAQSLGLSNTNGAIVAEVIDGSPAEKAGFRQGDVVLRMNSTQVKDNRDLSRRVAALQVGQSANFVVWRDNREVTVNVTIAKRPDPKALASLEPGNGGNDDGNTSPKGEAKVAALGIDIATITPALRSQLGLDREARGVVITDIDTDSDAAERGLQPGDRIVAVGGKPVSSTEDVNAAVATARSLKRPSVLLFVERGQSGKVYVPVKLRK